MTRRDSRGRRIGRNWWREHNMELFTLATYVWEEQREELSLGYPTERNEYERDHPRPNLKHFLIHNKGMNTQQKEAS